MIRTAIGQLIGYTIQHGIYLGAGLVAVGIALLVWDALRVTR